MSTLMNLLLDTRNEPVFPTSLLVELPYGKDVRLEFYKTCIGGGAIAVARGFDDVRVIFWYDN